MRLTERDKQMVLLVAAGGALTAEQLQIGANHSLLHDSRCQARLTALVQQHYLAMLPRKATDKAVYVVNRKAYQGIRLLKACIGEDHAKKQLSRRQTTTIDHTLIINTIWVRVLRACTELGYTLNLWQRSDELVNTLKPFQLIPDSYFQIARPIPTETGELTTKTAGFALEVERTSRDSSVLSTKLKKYRSLYYGDKGKDPTNAPYPKLFATPSLRVLVVFASASLDYDNRRVKNAVKQAGKLGVSIAHFASLAEIQALPPSEILTQPIWYSPRSAEAVALYS